MAIEQYLTEQLVIKALKMAIINRRPSLDLLMHSGRVNKYASIEYQSLLNKYGMVFWMSRKGNCYDIAVMESFFTP